MENEQVLFFAHGGQKSTAPFISDDIHDFNSTLRTHIVDANLSVTSIEFNEKIGVHEWSDAFPPAKKARQRA